MNSMRFGMDLWVCMMIILLKPWVLLGFHLNPIIMESKVYMKCRVELGIKHIEKCEKTHILDIFGSCVPVHLECVPVHPSRIQSVPVHTL